MGDIGMNTSFQFYPTPTDLALKAWAKFENKSIVRLLEPSAGQGNLITALRDNQELGFSHKRKFPYFSHHERWEAVELNPNFHPLLREKKANVLGYDFLSINDGARYSHIIMNPPFAHDVHHVLHAWDILYEGEVVAIINAQTIRNTYSKERKRLVALIERHGSVEYVEGAFLTDDTERKTEVEVALVHLKKTANAQSAGLLDYLDELAKRETGQLETPFIENDQELMIPGNLIDNVVRNYHLAIKANLQAQQAIKLAKKYRHRLDAIDACADENEGEPASVSDLLVEDYEKIHHSAWDTVINSSIVTSKLSSHTAKKVERELASIYQLAFTKANIYGFLAGLAEQRGAIQSDMMLEVFDNITMYHSTNTCYYLGWKSNDAHLTVGKSIKMSRFILPMYTKSWGRGDGVKRLRDIESVFLYLDGKNQSEISLAKTFENEDSYRELASGARITTDYFDIRYYPTRDTMHFFPRRAELIERLNVFVGKQRQWLPENMHEADSGFQEQFAKAEAATKQADLMKALSVRDDWDLARKLSNDAPDTIEKVVALLFKAHNDLNFTPQLTHEPQGFLLASA